MNIQYMSNLSVMMIAKILCDLTVTACQYLHKMAIHIFWEEILHLNGLFCHFLSIKCNLAEYN